jgi:ubiquitin-like-conjugating enzyme ATG10
MTSKLMLPTHTNKAVIARSSQSNGFEAGQYGYVRYEAHLHPTFRTPCLWFSLYGLPADEDPFSIDTVFRRLVPDEFKAGLRTSIGTVDGISLANHPATGAPTFFVHPCRLGEAMANFDSPKEDYISVWLGLVGQCVGLWVPPEMAIV